MSGGSGTTGMYNSTGDNTMYVGYMYGTTESLANNRTNTNNSNIKTVIDSWYSKTINVKTDASGNTYDKYVSKTAIYCNDRSGDGYTANVAMYYSAYNRLYSNNAPSYKCGNGKSGYLYSDADVADKFSASTGSGGNGKLTYPIALVAADEIAFAGGMYHINAQAWYYYNSAGGSVTGSGDWWTMSPFSFRTSDYCDGLCAQVFRVVGSVNPGYLYVANVDLWTPGVRPVLSLKSCVQVTGGNGSSTTPYTLTVSSTCAAAEN